MDKAQKSVFQEYYQPTAFIDRYADRPDGAVDVIVPIIHTNELWEANLLSIYREIPVHRLLIGDGGCIDNSVEIARKFPRVEVLDHRSFTSLGYSLRKLIEAVQTEWFVYLHSDVYLPPDWFAEMCKHQKEYDWFECRQKLTVLVEYEYDVEQSDRALSGAQMGRAKTLQQVASRIDDDFLYRNEDMILAGMVREQGYKYGWANDMFHYHQIMYKQSAWARKIKTIAFQLAIERNEEVRTALMQVKGLVKYLDPNVDYVKGILINVNRLQEMGELTWQDFQKWVEETNPSWLPLIIEEVKKADSSWLPLIVEEVKKIDEAKKNESKKFTPRLAQKLCKLINKALGVG